MYLIKEQFTMEQWQVIIGSLLGDASVTIDKNAVNAYYQENHGPKQFEYCQWKASVLDNYITYSKQVKNGKYQQWRISSPKLPVFTSINYLFYPNKFKIVTREILDQLEPLGLACWYMDDGCFDKNTHHRASFSTHGFTKEENELVKTYLKEKWGIDSTLWTHPAKDGSAQYYVVLSKEGTEKLFEVVRPYMHASLLYKCPEVRTDDTPIYQNTLLDELRDTFGKRYFTQPEMLAIHRERRPEVTVRVNRSLLCSYRKAQYCKIVEKGVYQFSIGNSCKSNL